MIRDVVGADAARLAEIYNYYIRETVITFEIDEIAEEEMASRIAATTGRGHPWIVIEDDNGLVVGYAYADMWRKRIAYQHTVESAIYLDKDAVGNGYGKQIYQALIDRLKTTGRYHAVIGGLTVPNEASERLHRSLGFQDVALFPQVGRKFDQWLDVKMTQLILDSNS